MNGNEEEFGNKELKTLARDVIPMGSPNTIPIEKSLQIEKNAQIIQERLTEQNHTMKGFTMPENGCPKVTAPHLVCREETLRVSM